MDTQSGAHDGVSNGAFTAWRVADDLSYGVGAIAPLQDEAAAEEELIKAVLAAIDPVAESELPYAACTDGRLPLKLLDGAAVPVREQLVGADMVSAFFVAEVLGARFYAHADAPVAERITEVARFLHSQGLQPSTHVGCGAAGGFASIVENVVRFGRLPQYVARLQALLPPDVFDAEAHKTMLATQEVLLNAKAYEQLKPEMFVEAVRAVSGDHAVAELCDDGRGVHGHVEEAIVRLRLNGQALNPQKLVAHTGGRQVFGVSDARMERLARLFARSAQDYPLAAMALEDFASSGHATLAKNLPTYVITPA